MPLDVKNWLASMPSLKMKDCYLTSWEGFPAPLGSRMGSVAGARKLHKHSMKEENVLLVSEQEQAAKHYSLKLSGMGMWLAKLHQGNPFTPGIALGVVAGCSSTKTSHQFHLEL
jgi:hypothetical protein